MKVTIVGTGYVGLVTGTCFAETGLDIVCVDIDKKKIQNLNKGTIPIYEPGLDRLIARNTDSGRLQFTSDYKEAIEGSSAVFIAVGTPPGEDGSADLKYVLNVAAEIGSLIKEYIVVVTKSTVPVGTADKVRKAVQDELDKRKADIPFDIASNPEFLKEGDAIDDFLKPDRIVIGTDSPRAEKIMKRLYNPFLLNGHPLIFMDIPSAEMTKYAANAMLATKISFINDVANLCERTGADVNLVRKGIGSDSRIGNKFIYAGVGYGGSCFPKDVKALIRTGKDYGYPMRILEAVEEVNLDQKGILVDKVSRHYAGNLKGKILTVWGLSFKPNTDDTREAPAAVVISELQKAGCQVKAFDPVAMEEFRSNYGEGVIYTNDRYEALIDSEGLILVTEWSEFRILNYPVMKKLMKEKVIFDGRNIYDPVELEEHGFKYYGIGRN
ncbi:UDP-glucose dehydrogenase family protein [Bacteroidota bacterium]